jgi:membrane protein DedA with SNARE-associated domain
MNALRFVGARLREASSWAGISAVLGTLGGQLPAPVNVAVFSLAAAAAILAVLLRDPGSPH